MKAMTKYFRKYSRVLVLVVMSLLLVLFLVGDVVGRATRDGAERDIEIGKAFGSPVYQSKVNQSDTNLRLAMGLGMSQIGVFGGDEHEQAIGAYLLLEEARRAGVRVPRGEIEAAIKADAARADAFNRICRDQGRSQASVLQTLAEVQAADRLMRFQMPAAGSQSDPRVEEQFVEQQQSADVKISAIDSRAFVSQVPEPTAEEIQAHFDAAKARKEAHTDDELVFGYLIPDRVVVEYLTIDPLELVESVTVLDRDAKAYYDKNKRKYTKPVDGPQEPGRAPATVQLEFAEARDKVKEDVRKAKAAEQAQRILNQILQEARAPWDKLQPDEAGRRPAPAEKDIVSFESLRERHSKQANIILRRTELVDFSALAREPGFGQARMMFGRFPIQAHVLAFNVEGLPTQASARDLPKLHVNEPSSLLNRYAPGAGQVVEQSYLMRVVSISPSGPPASLDEVREKVVDNVKLQKAHELAGQAARALSEQARKVGLEAAVDADEALKKTLTDAEAWAASQPAEKFPNRKFLDALTVTSPPNFSRRGGFVPNVGFIQTLGEKVFALTTQPASEGAAHKVTAIDAPRVFKWVVAEFKELKPLYLDDFKRQQEQVRQMAMQSQMQQFYMQWLNLDNIYKRTGFSPAANVQ